MENIEIKDRNGRVEYTIIHHEWLDKDTLVVFTDDKVDEDDFTYSLEVEWHRDEQRITYTRVYEYCNVNAKMFVSKNAKRKFLEYISKECKFIGFVVSVLACNAKKFQDDFSDFIIYKGDDFMGNKMFSLLAPRKVRNIVKRLKEEGIEII